MEFPNLCAAETNLLNSFKQQKMGYAPFGSPCYFRRLQRALPLLPPELPTAEECRERPIYKDSPPPLPSHNWPETLHKSLALFHDVNMHHIGIKVSLSLNLTLPLFNK